MTEPTIRPLSPYGPAAEAQRVDELTRLVAERDRQLAALHDEVRSVLESYQLERADAPPTPGVLPLAEAMGQLQLEYGTQQQDLDDERRARRIIDTSYVAYLRAMVAALNAADLAVADWGHDHDEPVGGCIALEVQGFEGWLGAGQSVCLCWSEVYGWYSGIGSTDRSGHLHDVNGSGLDIAAPAAEVVAWAHHLRNHGPRSLAHTVRAVREVTASDDLV